MKEWCAVVYDRSMFFYLSIYYSFLTSVSLVFVQDICYLFNI